MRTRSSRISIRISLAILSIGVGGWLCRPLLAQKAQTPSEFYLAYSAAAEKMKSFKDIAP